MPTPAPTETPAIRVSILTPTPPQEGGAIGADPPAIRVSTFAPKSSPTPTPPPEEPPAQFAGYLFLGGLGSMILGCVYVLFRAFKRKKRPKTDRSIRS